MEITIGQRLKELIDENKISKKDLADKINVHPSAVTQFVKDSNKPKLDTSKSIAQYFGVNIEWLLTGEGNKYRNTERPGASTTTINKSKSTGNTVSFGNPGNMSNTGNTPDLQAENDKLRLENEYLKQRLKDKEEMIELLKRK